MLRLSTPNNEKFIQADEFDVCYGGGEANVAVSLANYGHDAAFVTKVPENPIGVAGFSYMGGSVKTTESRPQPLPDLRVYLGYFGIGMGYGYNMVIKRRWLLHASALPTFVVLNRSNIRVSGTRSDLSTGLPNVILTERMALIYNVKPDKFFGGTFVVTHSFLGDDHMVLNYSKWRARVFWGMRF